MIFAILLWFSCLTSTILINSCINCLSSDLDEARLRFRLVKPTKARGLVLRAAAEHIQAFASPTRGQVQLTIFLRGRDVGIVARTARAIVNSRYVGLS